MLQGSLLLSRILYQQKQALPKLKIEAALADQIADIRLYQFELNKQREGDQRPRPAMWTICSAANRCHGGRYRALRSDLLRDQLETRRELIDRLNRWLNALLNESITLQLNQKELESHRQKPCAPPSTSRCSRFPATSHWTWTG